MNSQVTSRLKSEVKSTHQMLIKVIYRGFWQFTFHGVHFDYDAQNSFSVHDSRTPK